MISQAACFSPLSIPYNEDFLLRFSYFKLTSYFIFDPSIKTKIFPILIIFHLFALKDFKFQVLRVFNDQIH